MDNIPTILLVIALIFAIVAMFGVPIKINAIGGALTFYFLSLLAPLVHA